MRMLYCRKCGTAIVSDETLMQSILDQMDDVRKRIQHAKGIERPALIQQLSEYKSMYKALMHNITQREQAENVKPYILRELRDTILSRKLMTEDEVNQIYKAGEQKAKKAAEQLRKKEKEIYGSFEAISNNTKPDPTANEAIHNVDQEAYRRRTT